MVRSVEGVFRDGRVELLESPPVSAETRVIITFLSEPKSVVLAERGISCEQAADLRRRLRTFEDDWNDPAMDVYDAI